MSEEQNTTDVTDALPTMDEKTRSRVKTISALLLGAAVAGLIIDDQVKKFKDRKSVKLTVVDKPED
jgi:hypothetical protein